MTKKLLVSINGKFLGAPSTGVQRVAEELVLAIDKLLTENATMAAKLDVTIIAPSNVNINLDLKSIQKTKKGILSGYLKNIPWEQFNLPFLSRGSKVLSLCNIAPIIIRDQIVMMHDAQVYSSPESYSKGFRLWYKFALPFIGKMCQKIITVSEFSKQELVKHGVAKAEKIMVIHNGCDHILRTIPDTKICHTLVLENTPYVLAQSNRQTHKNIGILLKAFESQALKPVKLVLYGATSKQDFINGGATVPENVIFTGRVSDGELRTLYTHALATLTPSLTEGFGLQPLEGMILGCPAIVTTCGALPEVCGDVALYADPYDAETWVVAIKNLLDDDSFAKRTKESSQAYAQKFSWENAANKVINLIITT